MAAENHAAEPGGFCRMSRLPAVDPWHRCCPTTGHDPHRDFLSAAARRALSLDAETYEDVEADATATPAALATVVLAAIATGIGLRAAGGAGGGS